ncbi:hypothetical protein AVEN_225492-1, partial [Araneus ventricosus]
MSYTYLCATTRTSMKNSAFKNFMKTHWQIFSRQYIPQIARKPPESVRKFKPVFYRNFGVCFNALQKNGSLLKVLQSNPMYHPSKGDSCRYFRTSASNFNSEDPNKKPEDEDESKTSLLAKSIIWLMMAYIAVTLLSLSFPNSNQPEVLRFVSWHEFLYHILAKGEVEEVVVNPEMDLVTIYVHDGAIIKGRR